MLDFLSFVDLQLTYFLLNNPSTLGVATGDEGNIIITDNDVIEKSNLNRQFLFRSEHIQQHKSVVAAEVIKHMNKQIKIEAHQYKVCHAGDKNK